MPKTVRHLKVLPPTQREKQRYLVYEAEYFGKSIPSFREAKEDILDAILAFMGELTYAGAHVQMVKGTSKRGIIRVNRDALDHLRVALATITHLHRCPARLRSLGVSGNIAIAEKYYKET